MSALSPSKDLGVKIGDSGPVSILQLFTSRASRGVEGLRAQQGGKLST